MVEDVSDRPTPDEEPRTHVPDGDGPPGGPPTVVSRWRRTYGASPLHLLLHLAAIVLIAWALSQAFDSRYEAAYKNLAIWMVGGAILNDFVALPLYVGIDRAARTVWGLAAGTRGTVGATQAAAPTTTEGAATSEAPSTAADGDVRSAHGPSAAADGLPPAAGSVPQAPPDRVRSGRLPAVLGNGHVRFPLVMSGVLLLVYFPNITHKAPIGHRLSTGLAEQPDWAGRWLMITAGLLIGSAVLYALRVALHRRRAGRAAPTAQA